MRRSKRCSLPWIRWKALLPQGLLLWMQGLLHFRQEETVSHHFLLHYLERWRMGRIFCPTSGIPQGQIWEVWMKRFSQSMEKWTVQCLPSTVWSSWMKRSLICFHSWTVPYQAVRHQIWSHSCRQRTRDIRSFWIVCRQEMLESAMRLRRQRIQHSRLAVW